MSILKFGDHQAIKLPTYKKLDFIDYYNISRRIEVNAITERFWMESLERIINNRIDLEDQIILEKKSPLPSPLYRFRPLNLSSIENFINDTHYCSNPIHFNDPFDSYFSQLDFDSEMVDKGSWTAFEGLQGKLRKLGFDPYLAKPKGELGICCFTSYMPSYPMWSHYADNHKGFVLQYNTQLGFESKIDVLPCHKINSVMYLLGDNLSSSTYIDSILDQIKLIESRKILKEAIQFFIKIIAPCIKLHVWEQEREWRYIDFFEKESDRIVKFPKPRVIYLGVRMEKRYKDLLTGIAKEKGILVRTMKMYREGELYHNGDMGW